MNFFLCLCQIKKEEVQQEEVKLEDVRTVIASDDVVGASHDPMSEVQGNSEEADNAAEEKIKLQKQVQQLEFQMAKKR